MLKKVRILGVKIYNVTLKTAMERVVELLESGEKSMIFTPNTEIVMEAQKDLELKEILNKGTMVIPDGSGLIIASKIHKLGLEDRVPGIELMGEMLNAAHKKQLSIYLFGSKPGVVEKAADNIKRRYPAIKVAGVRNGYYDESQMEDIIADINEKAPDFLFVALGAPKQEKWIYSNIDRLNVKIAMGVGGSLDVYAGVARRAPVIFQRLYLEWFYRLLKEPKRIGRMMNLPKFLAISIFYKDFYKEKDEE